MSVRDDPVVVQRGIDGPWNKYGQVALVVVRSDQRSTVLAETGHKGRDIGEVDGLQLALLADRFAAHVADEEGVFQDPCPILDELRIDAVGIESPDHLCGIGFRRPAGGAFQRNVELDLVRGLRGGGVLLELAALLQQLDRAFEREDVADLPLDAARREGRTARVRAVRSNWPLRSSCLTTRSAPVAAIRSAADASRPWAPPARKAVPCTAGARRRSRRSRWAGRK